MNFRVRSLGFERGGKWNRTRVCLWATISRNSWPSQPKDRPHRGQCHRDGGRLPFGGQRSGGGAVLMGLAVCGTGSGVGKTTITAGLMAALRKRGFSVQPFKCGPDFIDPGHHARVCGRPSHNLDTWLLSPDRNKELFAEASAGADVAIVEGMMGLFDGVRGRGEEGSSAEIAKLVGLPVILVVEASSAALSVAAIIHGFRTFDPSLRFAGVILNRVAGPSH